MTTPRLPLRLEHHNDGSHYWQIVDADGQIVAEAYDEDTAEYLCRRNIVASLEPIAVVPVPTYLGEEGRDYAEDSHAVYVYAEAGVRLCLGGDRESSDRPDICVEKFAEGWRVFIHPANADPDYVIELRPKSTRVEDCGGNLIHETEHDWS